MANFFNRVSTVIIIIALLQGCGAVLVGGAAVGVSVIHDRRSSSVVLEDKKIELTAASRLGEDKILAKGSHVSFVSYNRTVLITGQVDSDFVKLQIHELAQGLPGVIQVIDEVAVTHPASFQEISNDVYITSRVKLALFELNLPDFDPTRVKVVTELGRVYLMGILTRQEADEVINKVRYVSGVVRVISFFEYVTI